MQKINLKAKVTHSLEKVFPDRNPQGMAESALLTALRGETVSFQVALYGGDTCSNWYRIKVESPIKKQIQVREVYPVPCSYPTHPQSSGAYLRTAPGLFPDLLSDVRDNMVTVLAGWWKSLWVDVEYTPDLQAGTYPVDIILLEPDSETIAAHVRVEYKLLDISLPKQTLVRTEWFHGDCLADYYQVPVFSQSHWNTMERFIRTAVKRGINMILTPLFTPPLDTAEGGERTTIQLVDVSVDKGKYQFDFGKLERWINMCLQCGVEYFEMSHLFSQWGAKYAPKVIAAVDGVQKQIFGWHTLSDTAEYACFLSEFLPALTTRLREWGIAERTVFHVSDEPSAEQLSSYQKAKELVEVHLDGFAIMDALSDYSFYQTGAVENPVCSNDKIHTFLENGVNHVWAYYCTAQHKNVSNRFFSMPSSRNRIYGVQLFKYGIKGMLHWGYNFYNAQYSIHPINPYLVTDAQGVFPGGDAYLVYPGRNGIPEESIRMMVLDEAMNDLRAMELLASLTSRDYVCSLIDAGLKTPVTFSQYPDDAEYLLNLRQRVNEEIATRYK